MSADASAVGGEDKGIKRVRDVEDVGEGTSVDPANGVSKRVASGDGTAPDPLSGDAAAAEEQVVDYAEVSDEQVGRVIGKQGATIRAIQNLSRAHVDVPSACDEGSTMRKIKVTGSASEVSYCKILIQKYAEDATGEAGIPLPTGGQLDPDHQVTTKTALVPNDQVGRIIGKGGATIRQLQELSNAHIDVAKECPPGSWERPVTLTGTAKQIAACEDYIQRKLRGDALPTAPAEFGPQTEKKVTVPNDMVGRIIGKGGATIREIQDGSGAHMDVAKECQPGSDLREVTITGTSQQVEFCNALLQAKVSGDYNSVAAAYGMYPGQQQQQQQQQYPGYAAQYAAYGSYYNQSSNPYAAYMYGAYGQQGYGAQQPAAGASAGAAAPAAGAAGYGQPPAAGAPGYGQPPAAGASSGYGTYDYSQWAQQAQQQAGGAPPAAAPPAGAAASGYSAPPASAQGGAYGAVGQQYGAFGGYGAQPAAPTPGAGAAGGAPHKMQVPNDIVGRLIGKAGATINEIQQQSGAHVDVTPDTGAPYREVVITGDPNAIAYCQQLIQARIASRTY